jgi:isoleucyl-tRNA synthetase
MDVVDQIRWIPAFGYERELDWLRNMHDWMISKKRYWGLALPIWVCAEPAAFRRDRRRARAERSGRRGLGDLRGPHAAPALHRRGQDRLPAVRRQMSRIPDVGNPWLDAGIVPFSTLGYRTDPEYWRSGSRPTGSAKLPRPVPQLVLQPAGHGTCSSASRPS